MSHHGIERWVTQQVDIHVLVIDQSSSQVVAVIQSLWSKGKLSLRTVIVDGKKYVGSTIVVNRYFVIKVTVNG